MRAVPVFVVVGAVLAFGAGPMMVRPAALGPDTTAARFAAVRTTIETALRDEQIPSFAIAVVVRGQIVWEEGFGWADRANRIRATPHTMYNIGSVSKPITATGLMTLVERGRMALGEPINRYLGGAQIEARVGNAAGATVQRLANHTSGLARHSTIYYADEPFSPPSMDEVLRRFGYLMREPGETYEYSNLGYMTLAYAAGRVSGQGFPAFMRQAVFTPLGMLHTAVGMDSTLARYYAVAYAHDQSPVPFALAYYAGGSGDIHSSAHDLARFALFHLGNPQPDQKRILADTSVARMHTPTVTAGPGEGYGLGWRINPDKNGYRQVYHTGSNGYGTAIVTLLPEEGVAVAAVASGYTALVVTAADAAIGTVLPRYREQMNQRAKAPTSAVPSDRQPYRPSDSLTGHWVGAIEVPGRKLPVDLWLLPSAEIQVQLEGQQRTLVSGARIQEGYLRGSFSSDIGTDDANRRGPYNLSLKLRLRGAALNGSVSAVTSVEDRETSATRRVGNDLSYWIEVRKAAP